MRISALLLVALVLAGCGRGAALPAPQSRLMTATKAGGLTGGAQSLAYVSLAFPAWDPSIKAILESAVEPQDYIVRTIAKADPVLLQRVGGYTHVFEEPNNDETGSQQTVRSVATMFERCPTGRIILFNIEHWQPSEPDLSDPAGAIQSAAAQTNAAVPCGSSGYTKYVAGVATDGSFEGWNACVYNNKSPGAFYNAADWKNTGNPNSWQSQKIYDLQAQTNLSTNPSNLCYGSIPLWWGIISDRIAQSKAGNPTISIWTELSLRDEDWSVVVNAIQYSEHEKALGARAPSVYWLSYPLRRPQPPLCPNPAYNPPNPHTMNLCMYVAPQNLQTELHALGRPTPVPSATPVVPTYGPLPTPVP